MTRGVETIVAESLKATLKDPRESAFMIRFAAASKKASKRRAEEIGVSYILLAGGEPMLRRDIIEAAGKMPNIIFPIFTNGTYMDDAYFTLFDK